jgi:hypothetical protein
MIRIVKHSRSDKNAIEAFKVLNDEYLKPFIQMKPQDSTQGQTYLEANTGKDYDPTKV